MVEGWKKCLVEVLLRLKILRPDFTGKIIINLNQGGITDIDRVDKIK